jgi:formylglycine-generating enzyme required for sulfatase activity
MSNRIFISYRREDRAGSAGRIYDQLAAHFGPGNIFMDVDDIDPGVDFVESIENAISQTNVLVVIIGPAWLGVADAEGNRRLENPEDFVRIEITAALKRNIRVIPVLIDRATMPRSTDLPDDLKLLARRNAIKINHSSFRSDAQRLIGGLERAIEQAESEHLVKQKGTARIAQSETRAAEAQPEKETTKEQPTENEIPSTSPKVSGKKRLIQVAASAAMGIAVLTVAGWFIFSSPKDTIQPVAPQEPIASTEVLPQPPQKSHQGSIKSKNVEEMVSVKKQSVAPEIPEVSTEVRLEAERNHKQGDMMIDKVTGMQFVYIPQGCFQMGSSNVGAHEQPVHEVCLDGYWMGKHEVAQGQWRKVMDGNPAHFQKGDDYPVEMVSWNDVQEFISELNKKSGKQFRLPTEAEWEYACKAKGNDTYCGGENINYLAWYSVNSISTGSHPVGTKQKNDFGLFDMTGNVWEWCQDWFEENYYRNSPRNNPQGPASGSNRVYRGGSWDNGAGYARSAFRYCDAPDQRWSNLGFRLVLPLEK